MGPTIQMTVIQIRCNQQPNGICTVAIDRFGKGKVTEEEKRKGNELYKLVMDHLTSQLPQPPAPNDGISPLSKN